jgi:hypothetical protein
LKTVLSLEVRVQIEIDPAASGLSLLDVDAFKRFNVVIRGTPSFDIVQAALAPIATSITPDSAQVLVGAVRELAGPATASPEWQRGFAEMLDYAERRGWLRPDSETIEAHLEWA